MSDLFISYARADNADGAVTSLVAEIGAECERLAGRKLNPFFDRDSIVGMDDWQDRILTGLRESAVLLTCLTPAYLTSDYCRWEFNEFLKGEIGRALAGAGIAPVYLIPIPKWETSHYDQGADWVKSLRGRNWFDLRGQKRESSLEALAREIAVRILRSEQTTAGGSNIESHNSRFTVSVR